VPQGGTPAIHFVMDAKRKAQKYAILSFAHNLGDGRLLVFHFPQNGG
jgi:hypothetical protein